MWWSPAPRRSTRLQPASLRHYGQDHSPETLSPSRLPTAVAKPHEWYLAATRGHLCQGTKLGIAPSQSDRIRSRLLMPWMSGYRSAVVKPYVRSSMSLISAFACAVIR